MNRQWLMVVAVMSLAVGSLQAQAALPIGSSASGTTSEDQPASFSFTPPGPGVLTVVVSGGDDLVIQVVDQDGQPLPNGRADGDNNGSTGLEFLALPVGNNDPLIVRIELLSEDAGSGAFVISAAFVREDGFNRPSDPDRRPSLARTVSVGAAIEESLNPAEGDQWDWYTIRASEAMTVAIVTRMNASDEGDLIIEAFTDNDFTEAVARSDQDLQGHNGNESVTIDLKAGQVLHFKITALWESGGLTPYRLSVGRVP
jgi:hypothetical protein